MHHITISKQQKPCQVLHELVITEKEITKPGVFLSYHGKRGETILSILQRLANIETLAFANGVYVKSIDGISTNCKRGWLVFVNGTLVSDSVDAIPTKDGDIVEWRLARSR